MLILMLRTKVPGNESSTYGTFVPRNESSRVRKFQLPFVGPLLDKTLPSLQILTTGCKLRSFHVGETS